MATVQNIDIVSVTLIVVKICTRKN